jgi:hypothetical protein
VNDTPREIEHKLMEMVLSRSGEERFISGIQSFEAARAIVISSLPKHLSEEELKHCMFKRIYGLTVAQSIVVVRDGPEDQ